MKQARPHTPLTKARQAARGKLSALIARLGGLQRLDVLFSVFWVAIASILSCAVFGRCEGRARGPGVRLLRYTPTDV